MFQGNVSRMSERLRLIDRVLFSLFVFSYLFFFQVDLERYVHIMITGGSIVFHPFLLSLIFTGVIILLEIPFSRLLKFRNGWEPLNFLPSMVLLGASTSHNEVHFAGYSLAGWIIIVIVSVIILFVCAFLAELLRSNKSTFSALLSLNMFLVTIMMLVPVCLGNTDEYMHRELRAGYYMEKGEYEKVLRIGVNAEETTPGLEALRADALARLRVERQIDGSELGNRLFRYPQKYPDMTAAHIVADTLASGAEMENRRLSALLLRKDIGTFSRTLCFPADSSVLNVTVWKNSMPEYYMQALLLEDYLRTDSIAVEFNRNSPVAVEMSALLQNYLAAKDKVSVKGRQIQANALLLDFGHTYYYYYDYK